MKTIRSMLLSLPALCVGLCMLLGGWAHRIAEWGAPSQEEQSRAVAEMQDRQDKESSRVDWDVSQSRGFVSPARAVALFLQHIPSEIRKDYAKKPSFSTGYEGYSFQQIKDGKVALEGLYVSAFDGVIKYYKMPGSIEVGAKTLPASTPKYTVGAPYYPDDIRPYATRIPDWKPDFRYCVDVSRPDDKAVEAYDKQRDHGIVELSGQTLAAR